MATTIGFALGQSSKALLSVAAPRRSPGNFIKNFFVSADNRCTSYVKKTSAVDKVIKVAAASSDLAKAVAERTGASSGVLGSVNAAQSAFSGARMVIGLFNVFNGCIPSVTEAVKHSLSFGKALHFGQEVVCIGGKSVEYEGASGTAFSYNQIFLGKKEQALGLGMQVCRVVSGLTYSVGFGVIRSSLFANKVGGFMSAEVKTSFSDSFNILMCANHAATFTGEVLSLSYEKMAHKRARDACLLERRRFTEGNDESGTTLAGVTLRNLDSAYRFSVITRMLTLIEKFFDLIMDVIKLTPQLLNLVPAEAKAVLGLLTGCIGVYKIWRIS